MFYQMQRNDVSDIIALLSQCPVIPINFIDSMLLARGKNDYQIQSIKNQLIRNHYAYTDSSNVYFYASRNIQSKDYDAGRVKALWFVLELKEDIEKYFIRREPPLVLSFVCKTQTDDNPFFDVFYIKFGDEKISTYNIISKYSEPVMNADPTSQLYIRKVFIIVDDPSQIPKIVLPADHFKVYRFVTIGVDGKVTLLQ